VFTGIVREKGAVVGFSPPRLEIDAPATAAGTSLGDSISVSGVCLTVVGRNGTTLAFDVVDETVARSSLGRTSTGDEVNIEPAVRAGEPLGGHYVQGHVDAVGRIRSVDEEATGRRVWIDAPPDVLRYCVEKGSIAVDGVSLTIAVLDDEGFAVALVPHTLAATTLGDASPADEVNLETDVLAKYVGGLVAR
jgi:riboflavin synthase